MYDSMNKGQLRLACTEKGISFDGLSVEQMRAALSAHVSAEPVQEAPVEVVAEPVQEVIPAEVVPVPEVAPTVQLAPVPALIVPPVVRAVREEANGVKMPAPGTICREIWDHCDTVYNGGVMPQAKLVRAWGAGRLDDTTMTVQFYRWRKFRGIAGRQA